MKTKQNANLSIADGQFERISSGQAGATPLTVSVRPGARIPMR